MGLAQRGGSAANDCLPESNRKWAIEHSREVANRERFEFGANWNLYLASLEEARIHDAEESLKRMLELETLAGRKFLDIGSGSGLFSLAARRLGATVYSGAISRTMKIGQSNRDPLSTKTI
jgi:predicted nicotinamide N-methyase